jgi:hypothetical protein
MELARIDHPGVAAEQKRVLTSRGRFKGMQDGMFFN